MEMSKLFLKKLAIMRSDVNTVKLKLVQIQLIKMMLKQESMTKKRYLKLRYLFNIIAILYQQNCEHCPHSYYLKYLP